MFSELLQITPEKSVKKMYLSQNQIFFLNLSSRYQEELSTQFFPRAFLRKFNRKRGGSEIIFFSLFFSVTALYPSRLQAVLRQRRKLSVFLKWNCIRYLCHQEPHVSRSSPRMYCKSFFKLCLVLRPVRSMSVIRRPRCPTGKITDRWRKLR